MHSGLSATKSKPAASRGRLLLGSLAAVSLALAGAYWLGPRNAFGPMEPSPRPEPPQDLAVLANWIQQSESAYPDIKPGNAKSIVWMGAPGSRTHWSVVYIHGFSASPLETAPLAQTVAKQLGANLFNTRLSGHGRTDGNAMGQARVQDWMADTLEAVHIGQALGERVLLISCSTGSTLATWLGTSADATRVSAHVLISPNYGLRDKRSEIINAPWGQKIALWLEGSTHSDKAESPEETNAWTLSYPTQALFPMMALVKTVRESDLSRFQAPALVLFSERDQTVDPAAIRSAFARLGSSHKSIVPVSYSQSRGQHVLAGAIKDPAAVAPMADTIVRWVQSLPKKPD